MDVGTSINPAIDIGQVSKSSADECSLHLINHVKCFYISPPGLISALDSIAGHRPSGSSWV